MPDDPNVAPKEQVESPEIPESTSQEQGLGDFLSIVGDHSIDLAQATGDQTDNGETNAESIFESPEERTKHFAQRFLEVTGQQSEHKNGPEKELQAWADSWKDFVETEALVPEGNFRNLLQDFGAQMIMGDMDGKALAKHMSKIQNSQDLQDVLKDLNDYNFKAFGVQLNAEFDKEGKLSSLELATKPDENGKNASLKVDSSGKVTATGFDADGKAQTEEDAVKKVARAASPLACP